MENFVVNLEVIIGRKERTFAVQKATSFGKITKIYHYLQRQKLQSFGCFASYLQASGISYFINLTGKT